MAGASSAGLGPREDIVQPVRQEKIDPIKDLFGLSTPNFFGIAVSLSLGLYEWPRWWLLSGTPILTYLILLGASRGYRILPIIPLWVLLLSLNSAYTVAGTSWLLWRLFSAGIYPAIFISCLFQFETFADAVRRYLRSAIGQLQFVNDKIAFFDIPALEIDTDVDGLFVVRGITLELSSLTITVHGAEVGIKLTDDMELALSVEKVVIPLFRRIEIGDVYGNLKGGQYEMQFGDLAERTEDADGDPVLNTDTPLLRAATAGLEDSRPPPPVVQKMRDHMTKGETPTDSSVRKAAGSVTRFSPEDSDQYRRQYEATIEWIRETNSIQECRKSVKKFLTRDIVKKYAETLDLELDATPDTLDSKDVRAAICTSLHAKPTIAHPPKRSIRVTTLQNLTPPHIRRFLHRLPMLLRALLNPLAYFHPVYVQSITAGGSGKWINHMLDREVFKDHGQHDAELRRLHKKVTAWLEEAEFVLELDTIRGLTQVPFLSAFDIICYLGFSDVLVYKAEQTRALMRKVIHLGGADATFTVPSFLLPHHEHILPPVPTEEDKEELRQEMTHADGKPKLIQKKTELRQAQKDECNVRMAAHLRLPAVLDQELLDFIARLVKATKVVEMVKGTEHEEIHNIKEWSHHVSQGMKDGFKKAVVEGIVNEQWISKMIGKATKLLETAVGDVGYTGNIPVALAPYRYQPGSKESRTKLLS